MQQSKLWVVQALQYRNSQVPFFGSTKTAGDEFLKQLTYFLNSHVFPVLSSNFENANKDIKEIVTVLDVDCAYLARWQYELQRLKIASRNEAELFLVKILRSQNDARVRDAVWGTVHWCTKSPANHPQTAFQELLDGVRRINRIEHSNIVGSLAELLGRHPHLCTESELDKLVHITVLLREETDLRNPENDARFDDPRWMLEARVEVARLAAVLWHGSKSHRTALEDWRLACEEGEESILREVWLQSARPNSV